MTPYYKAASSSRQAELDLCLERNFQNEFIDRIVLIIDDNATPPISHEKIIVNRVESRPTYADWLQLIKDKEIAGSVILANSDIYFDDSVSRIHEILRNRNTFMALTRWELVGKDFERHPNPQWSQDSWAISTDSLIDANLTDRLRFGMGVPRCDNKVAYVFATAGWKIKNPYSVLKTVHVHETAERSYNKRVDTSIVGGVAYVYPSEGINGASNLHFELWTLGDHNIVEHSLNRNLEKWKREDSSRILDDSTSLTPQTSSLAQKLELLAEGDKLFSATSRHMILEGDSSYLVVNSTKDDHWVVLPKAGPELMPNQCLEHLFLPVIEECGDLIKDLPQDEGDLDFWQYPCLTEKQAYQNHLRRVGHNFNYEQGRLNIYLPLPWATYIDKKQFPEKTLATARHKLAVIRKAVKSVGRELRVHTVCQHIHWRRTLDVLKDIGVTDLSISHCTPNTDEEVRNAGYAIKIHPWSLFAVNVATSSRSSGIQIGKPMRDRRYLASFIGAHMPHYRSDVRLRLFKGLSALDGDNVLVDLGDMWHFNRIVYDKQVSNKELDLTAIDREKDATLRYNEVLSDSKFALCPEGAGPNTLRLWESIAIGCVPVLFDRGLKFPLQFEKQLNELCLFWDQDRIDQSFITWLENYTEDELDDRGRKLREMYSTIETMTCF